MKFVFKARDKNRNIREGKVEAINRDAAIDALQKNELIPIFVTQETEGSAMMKEIKRMWEGVSAKEQMVLFRELATLIEAKVPIVPSLRAIQAQSENRYLRVIIKEIADNIEDGMPFSEALGKYPHTFSPLVVSMVKAGEVSGNLQRSITFLASNIERNYALTSKIKSALFYPAFVITAAGAIGFLTITFILPKLTLVIRELGVEVPWYTKALMGLGDFMQVYWWAILVLLVAGLGGLIYYAKTPDGKRDWDRLQLSIPIIGKLFRFLYIARFSENFAVLLTGGIPMVRSLTVVSEVVGNSVYESVILRAAEEVKSGGNVSTVFAKSPEIPIIVTQMVRIGEETGKTGDVLQNVAKFYEQEVDTITRNLASLLEPILIVVLGLGVAIMVFAIMLPIYNVAGQIS